MKNNPTLLMALGAITIAFSPILAKAVSLGPTMTAFYRFLFGAIVMVIFIKIKDIKLNIELAKKASPFFISAGALFALDLWFWHRSIIYTGAGIATLLANTQVFYLVLIGWIFNKERPKWFFYPAMLLAVLGITLTSLPFLNFDQADNSLLGVIFGLLTGLSYALVAFSMQRATTIYTPKGPWPITLITIVACFTSFIFALIEGKLEMIQVKDTLAMVAYGGGVHFFGWLVITYAITKIALSKASLLLLLQPVCSTIFGYLIYDEPLSMIQILGLIISLMGIYMSSIARR